MVQNVALSSTNMNHSSMSINSSIGSIDSPTVEHDVIAFQEIPLTALSKKSLRKLSNLLNSRKILRSEEGYERDWRGLASLAKQKCLCEENGVSGDDPMTKVIQLWCTNNPKTATFAYLEQFLGIIDRWDVSDDIYENLVEDTKTYQSKLQQCLDLDSDDNVDMNISKPYGDFGHGSDPNILTTSDVIRAQKGLPPQMYDAFVLYADADLNYASEMLTKLEDNPQYNFKLCMKDRDLLGGVQFEHVALTQLIEERCKHLIVILTEEFLKSPENKFLVNYTQALQIQHKTRKIVPLLYDESVDIPRTLKIYTLLRYNSGTSSLFNFWSKLANSIQNVNITADISTLSKSSCKNETNRISTANRQTSNKIDSQLINLPTPPTEIPSISIIPPDDNEKPMKEDRKLKHFTMRPPRNKVPLNDGAVLRNAHSTGQLNMSTTSICSETKKKKKWSSKILKKVFSRSSSKLQEA
ncbi:myeloid differentiation primary response protein MyD88 [Lucilia sericata]|uniref:myeloid differentiation primary response protein MyD88 n=1 Tax=Lucilia sericata TaxID=13632 RepID=UPI0018A800FE|nr:myeloid differentiation primary response protein MyD88 [Lucilia sericata]